MEKGAVRSPQRVINEVGELVDRPPVADQRGDVVVESFNGAVEGVGADHPPPVTRVAHVAVLDDHDPVVGGELEIERRIEQGPRDGEDDQIEQQVLPNSA